MAESDRRHRYAYNRVLIETDRILDPQFDDAVVFLSGAQLEMLRNVTQYLNRRATYVSEQFLDYYLAPTVADYDTILAIVAAMEESLMGNPNTIWGYEDRWEKYQGQTKSGDGDQLFIVETVPAGYVYVLHCVWSMNEDTTVTHEHYLHSGTREYQLALTPAVPANTWQKTGGLQYVLKAGDSVRVKLTACLDGDIVRSKVWGYKMAVPE